MAENVKKTLTGDFSKKKMMMFAITAIITIIVWNLPIDSFGIDGLTVVQRRVVPAVLGDGVADLLLLRSVAGEIGEEVSGGLGLGADSAGGQGKHKG